MKLSMSTMIDQAVSSYNRNQGIDVEKGTSFTGRIVCKTEQKLCRNENNSGSHASKSIIIIIIDDIRVKTIDNSERP